MRLSSYSLPYLLLVSFFSGQLTEFDAAKVRAVNDSPYHGVAVSMVDAYETGPLPLRPLEAVLGTLKNACAKHIWPWLYFNRFVGYDEKKPSHSVQSQAPYFQRIRGMDLNNETGALGDFYDLWRAGLRAARHLGSPGIVVDPELYNNYAAYEIGYLANEMKISPLEVQEALRRVGSELAEIAAVEFPEATLWFLFTGLSSPIRGFLPFQEERYRSVTYIVEGLLERVKAEGLPLKVVSGGEMSLGYCSKSLADLKSKVVRRQEAFSKRHATLGELHLGGTIAPWNRLDAKRGWLRQGVCGASDLGGAGDFTPLFKELLRAYGYVWIYAAMAAGYDPYDSSISPAFNAALKSALDDLH